MSDEPAVGVRLVGGVLELLRPQRVDEHRQRRAQQRQPARQGLREQQEGVLEPVELRRRPARDLGQLVVQLEDARVVVGQAAEG